MHTSNYKHWYTLTPSTTANQHLFFQTQLLSFLLKKCPCHLFSKYRNKTDHCTVLLKYKKDFF